MNKSHQEAILPSHINGALLDISVKDDNNGNNIMPIHKTYYTFTAHNSTMKSTLVNLYI